MMHKPNYHYSHFRETNKYFLKYLTMLLPILLQTDCSLLYNKGQKAPKRVHENTPITKNMQQQKNMYSYSL